MFIEQCRCKKKYSLYKNKSQTENKKERLTCKLCNNDQVNFFY